MKIRGWAAFAALMGIAMPGVGAAGGLLLNVPSPDWRDQIVYMVMTDRFADGDPTNDNQGAGEFDRTDGAKYSGGDLVGLQAHLDYVKGLGATTVWITPPVANMWWDPTVKYGGYHGYWARDFKAVDKHLGTLTDYQKLSDALHRRGMYLMQDVVTNHMANCFSYTSYDPAHPDQNVVLNTAAQPACGPVRAPFNQWNPTNPRDFAANVFHWTPAITDYTDRYQFLNYQNSNLDDLNTENSVVVEALKDSYAFWIKNVGVDAFRLDTTLNMPQTFLQQWVYGAGGVMAAAQSTGRSGFLVAGEGWETDLPYQDVQSQLIQSYTYDASGHPVLPAMFNFPLYATAGDIFVKGHPTAELSYRMVDEQLLFGDRRHYMPNFVDNHDVDRYLKNQTVPVLKQHLLYVMSIPGIPVVYYGTEQGFTEQRGAMFKEGYGSGGVDHWDTTTDLYRYIATIAQLRKAQPTLRRGQPSILKDNPAGPGVFAYKMTYGSQAAVMVFNTSDHAVLVDNMQTGLPAGAVLRALYFLGGGETDAVADGAGALTLPLAPREGRVYLYSGETRVTTSAGTIQLVVPNDGGVETANFAVTGAVAATGVATVQIVVDGDLSTSQSVPVQADGSFGAVVDVQSMADPKVTHTVTAYAAAVNLASNTGRFTVSLPVSPLVTWVDPAGDDVGPLGRYAYPTDASYLPRQGDIRQVDVQATGGSLRVSITTAKVTTVWSPWNGFDHVCFTIFIGVPGSSSGVTVMPWQAAQVPAGMSWNYRARAHGWSNAFFSSVGASATSEGTPTSPAAQITVDAAANQVTFNFPAAALGNLSSLSGTKVYVTTWDYDASSMNNVGGYRGLEPTPQTWEFSGGQGGVDPLVLDDAPVLTVP